MEIRSTVDGPLAIVAAKGVIDTRAATEFETELAKVIDGGARRLVVDFAQLELVTSAGIRVLVMVGKRLRGLDGGLVLCALSADVQRVFEIAGLTRQFRIAATRDEAVAALAPAAAASPGGGNARILEAATLLLGSRADAEARLAHRAAGQARSKLSMHVMGLLTDGGRQPRK